MSVINKMLRDLDQRQRAQHGALGQSMDEPNAVLATSPTPVRWPWVAAVVGIAMVAASYWTWQAGILRQFLETPAAPVAKVAPVLTAPAPAPAPTPAAAASEVPPVVAPTALPVETVPAVLTKPSAVGLRMDAQLNLRKLMETELAPVPVKAAPVPSPVVKPALSQATAPAQANAAATAPDATLAAQRQQQAARDAVAHAQSLWNAGSHESAIELMQEVLASSERTLANASNASNLQALSLAVRELARMQLAESRPAPVLELLIRLEPVLGNQADLWALRANAAQRLGRHQDSVHAYMVALQSRPNEQRWLLGTAVSLAALGQTASAADMAEKARAVGVVSKEVLAYLRQMGVPVKD